MQMFAWLSICICIAFAYRDEAKDSAVLESGISVNSAGKQRVTKSQAQTFAKNQDARTKQQSSVKHRDERSWQQYESIARRISAMAQASRGAPQVIPASAIQRDATEAKGCRGCLALAVFQAFCFPVTAEEMNLNTPLPQAAVEEVKGWSERHYRRAQQQNLGLAVPREGWEHYAADKQRINVSFPENAQNHKDSNGHPMDGKLSDEMARRYHHYVKKVELDANGDTLMATQVDLAVRAGQIPHGPFRLRYFGTEWHGLFSKTPRHTFPSEAHFRSDFYGRDAGPMTNLRIHMANYDKKEVLGWWSEPGGFYYPSHATAFGRRFPYLFWTAGDTLLITLLRRDGTVKKLNIPIYDAYDEREFSQSLAGTAIHMENLQDFGNSSSTAIFMSLIPVTDVTDEGTSVVTDIVVIYWEGSGEAKGVASDIKEIELPAKAMTQAYRPIDVRPGDQVMFDIPNDAPQRWQALVPREAPEGTWFNVEYESTNLSGR